MSLKTRMIPPTIPVSRNICSMPLYEANHSFMANPLPDVLVCVPAVETIAGKSSSRRKTIAADGDTAEEILLVICQFGHVVAGRTDGDHERQQMLLARMRSA